MERNAFSLDAEVLANGPAGARYHRMVLAAPEIAARAAPGQFVNLRVTRALDPLLGRPLSVFYADPDLGRLELLYKPVGRGTAMLAAVEAGGRLPVTGPLGRSFKLEENAEVHLAVGGGTGLAPVYFLACRAPDSHLLLGFRDRSYRLPEELAERTGARCRLASDAGEAGFHRGTVVDLLGAVLDGELAGRAAALYAAGPAMMMKGVAELAADRKLPCQCSLEGRMACGLSVCRGCVIRARTAAGKTVNRTVCTQGPVFNSAEVDWDAYAGLDRRGRGHA